MAQQTENQAKVADLLRMMNETGAGTLASELKDLFEEAWFEGLNFGEAQDFGYRTPVNPYMELGL